jgi:hypothetical protein
MSKEVVIRPYQPGDEVGIVKLLEVVFGGWPHFDLSCSPLEHWKWKHLENPFGQGLKAIGLSNDTVIGVNHIGFVRSWMGGKTRLCGQGLDLAVHPDFRGLRVSSKIDAINNKTFEGLNPALSYWVTTNPLIIKNALKNGNPHFPQQISDLIRIRDIDLHLEKNLSEKPLLKKYAFCLLKGLKKISSAPTRTIQNEKSKEANIRDIDRFDEGIDSFWNNAKDGYSFIVERSREYLNWRYCDPRGGKYIVKQMIEQDSVIGYIVLRINRYVKDYPTGSIVDLLTLPNRLDAADLLIREAIDYFDEKNINIIRCWIVRNHSYNHLLKIHGFVTSGTNIHILYNTFIGESELEEFNAATSDRLHFQLGDTDWI